jgi:hypothetical protein
LNSIDQFSDVKPELEALLGAHRDLTALIIDGDGKLLFADPGPVDIPKSSAQPQTTTSGSGGMKSRCSVE